MDGYKISACQVKRVGSVGDKRSVVVLWWC